MNVAFPNTPNTKTQLRNDTTRNLSENNKRESTKLTVDMDKVKLTQWKQFRLAIAWMLTILSSTSLSECRMKRRKGESSRSLLLFSTYLTTTNHHTRLHPKEVKTRSTRYSTKPWNNCSTSCVSVVVRCHRCFWCIAQHADVVDRDDALLMHLVTRLQAIPVMHILASVVVACLYSTIAARTLWFTDLQAELSNSGSVRQTVMPCVFRKQKRISIRFAPL